MPAVPAATPAPFPLPLLLTVEISGPLALLLAPAGATPDNPTAASPPLPLVLLAAPPFPPSWGLSTVRAPPTGWYAYHTPATLSRSFGFSARFSFSCSTSPSSASSPTFSHNAAGASHAALRTATSGRDSSASAISGDPPLLLGLADDVSPVRVWPPSLTVTLPLVGRGRVASGSSGSRRYLQEVCE